jgi:hypothetical protein
MLLHMQQPAGGTVPHGVADCCGRDAQEGHPPVKSNIILKHFDTCSSARTQSRMLYMLLPKQWLLSQISSRAADAI